MKFGKRLGAEAGRGWQGTYLDYKSCKRAISKDVLARDPLGAHFEAVILLELRKICAFFTEKEEELQAVMRTLAEKEPAVVASFRAEVLALRKYSVLNSTAVIKAVKKRNRHLGAVVGTALKPLHATELLSRQHFFTSTKLATLSTQAEILAQESPAKQDVAKTLEDYECPICLAILENPVILPCTHRFCWGCLLAHCATAKDCDHEHDHGASEKDSLKPGMRLLTAMLGNSQSPCTYACPVCREAHILDLDRLQVDQHLTLFIANLKKHQLRPEQPLASEPASPPGAAVTAPSQDLKTHALPIAPSHSILDTTEAPLPGLLASAEETEQEKAESEEAESEAKVEAQEAASRPQPPLLPPQAASLRGRLTVVLDLDGTLISSFTPRRAPSFSRHCNSYVVGKGAQLNPNGVLVVERPQLARFFQELNSFAEVVVFTAGLEDYAAPICTALEDRYGNFTATLFRPATVSSDAYPCVKDLSLLGRDLRRTVLVDDTPLAFLNQPDNGIPIFSFRGDLDDRVLPEAILPLLEQLAACEDVRPILHRRFNMPHWLSSHGILPSASKPPLSPAGKAKRRLHLDPGKVQSGRSQPVPAESDISEILILSDFDKTFTDCDAGDRLIGDLAPELAPMLASLQQPANFVPLTNAVLSEAARRGISRDQIQYTLRKMGSEIPAASKEMLRWAAQQKMDVRIISDCNTFFIGQMLEGANARELVRSVITNAASFEQSMTSDSAKDLVALDTCTSGKSVGRVSSRSECSQHLVIQPCHDENTHGSHGCAICPANLCKGLELTRLRKAAPYKRIFYLGDGANDLCPALRLTSGDTVLAREGYDLDQLIQKQQSCPKTGNRLRAKVMTWNTHQELFKLLRDVTAA